MTQSKTVYLIERQTSECIEKILVARSIKKAYELAKFHGRVAAPSLSYKTAQRRLMTAVSVFFYDTVRFENESEALYSPTMDSMIITRLDFK